MDLQEVWKKLKKNKLEKPVLGTVEIRKKSKHPVQKLKNAYLQTTGFSLAFLIGFIVLFFMFPEPIVKVGLALVIVGYVFFFVVNFNMYRKVNVVLPVDQNLKSAMQHTYDFITANIHFQEYTAVFIYPIAASAGFLMGGAVGSGDIDGMLQKKFVIIALIVTAIVLTPIAFYLTRWLYKVSYGKCLKELKERIDELENPN